MTRAVLKFGGEVVEDPEALAGLMAALRRGCEAGWQVLVVHGGGPQTSRVQHRLGRTPVKVAGRRVTTAEDLEISAQVLGGSVHLEVVSAALAAGLDAVGLAAGACGVAARRWRPESLPGAEAAVDFGYVGEVAAVDPARLEALWGSGAFPVLHPLCFDSDGQLLNVNADTVAGALARALRVDHFVSVTAVGGVFGDPNDPSTRIPRMTPSEVHAQIADGRIHGGMIPKVEDAVAALEAGVGAVHIVGAGAEDLHHELTVPGSRGTVFVRDGDAHA